MSLGQTNHLNSISEDEQYSANLPQLSSPTPPLPAKPESLDLSHSSYSHADHGNRPLQPRDLSPVSTAPSSPSINRHPQSPPSLSITNSSHNQPSTPAEYSSFYQQADISPTTSSRSAQQSPQKPPKVPINSTENPSEDSHSSFDAEKIQQNALLQRTFSAPDYSRASSIHRNSSTSSYQPSIITPCTTTQSTPELYGSKVDLNSADWGTFYNLTEEYLATLDTPTVMLQNEIHNLIMTEENYVVNTRVFLQVFGNGLADTLDSGREKFRQDAFVTLESVLEVNEQMLLKPLKADQEEHGPMLSFQVETVKNWAAAVREPILFYAQRHPYASEVVSTQKQSNERFKAFIDHGSAETTKQVRKEFSSLFENTRTRFGQYHMMFAAILKQMKKLDPEDPMISDIEECIAECRETLKQYNEIQGRIGSQLELARLEKSLRYKYAEDRIDLNLSSGDHEVVYRGKVKLKREVEVDNLEMILLDHFLLLISIKSDSHYIVTTKPIHLELLALESGTDDPMFKSSALAVVNKLTRNKSDANTPLSPNLNAGPRQNSVSSTASAPATAQLSSAPSSSSLQTSRLQKSSGSLSSMPPTTEYYTNVTLNQNNNMIYPIKIRNLATDQKYYVCTTSEITRKEWVKRICEAKARYSKRAFELRQEPLSLRIVDGTSFGYSQFDMPKGSIFTKDNALARALEEHKANMANMPPPLSSTTTSASIATTNTLTPIASGASSTPTPQVISTRLQLSGIKSVSSILCSGDVIYNNMRILFLGLNEGLWGCHIKDTDSPLNWVQIGSSLKVSRIEAVEDKNMLFVLSEKTLYLYKFNEVVLKILTSSGIQSHTKVAVSPPTILDQNVDCFKAGMLSSKPHLFYSTYTNKSTVTVLEITGKEQQKKSSRLFGFKNKTHGNEFKESDWLFTPTRNREITFFNSTFCIHTDFSFEVMNLEHKQPCSIPTEGSIARVAKKQGLPEPQIEMFRKRVTESRPISISKVPSRHHGANGNDFLLCYHKLAIMCNALGDLESAVCINYIRKISAAHVLFPYLVTFSDRIIEIRKLTGGPEVHQLVQVVTGRDIRMLGFGGGNDANLVPRLVFAMAHPEQPQRQIILEFVMNKDVTDDQSNNSLNVF